MFLSSFPSGKSIEYLLSLEVNFFSPITIMDSLGNLTESGRINDKLISEFLLLISLVPNGV